jgi:hypothetical protein
MEREEKKRAGGGRRGRSRSRGGKGGKDVEEVLFNPLKMDRRRLLALRVSRQVESMKMLERALNAAKRSDDVDVLHEGVFGIAFAYSSSLSCCLHC